MKKYFDKATFSNFFRFLFRLIGILITFSNRNRMFRGSLCELKAYNLPMSFIICRMFWTLLLHIAIRRFPDSISFLLSFYRVTRLLIYVFTKYSRRVTCSCQFTRIIRLCELRPRIFRSPSDVDALGRASVLRDGAAFRPASAPHPLLLENHFYHPFTHPSETPLHPHTAPHTPTEMEQQLERARSEERSNCDLKESVAEGEIDLQPMKSVENSFPRTKILASCSQIFE